MEDAPTPGFVDILNEKILNTSEFKLNYENSNYILKINSTENNLYLEIKQEDNFICYYEIVLRLIELTKFDKIFRTCENIKEAYDLMVSNVNHYKNAIKSISDNSLNLLINILQPNNSVVEKEVILNKKYYKNEVVIEKLSQEVKELKLLQKNMEEEISELRKENNRLKELDALNELKDKINYYFDSSIIKSSIITEEKNFDFIKERLKKVNIKGKEDFKLNFELLYRASRHGDRAKDFHLRCDSYRNTLTIIKTTKGFIFGGFTTKTWEGIDSDKKDENAFCFSLNKHKIYNSIKGKTAIFVSQDKGPCFQNCIFEVNDKFFENYGNCDEDANAFYDNIETICEINGGNNSFLVENLEVFAVYFE